MPAFKEMRGVTLATQVLSHMVAAGQILAFLTKIQRHQLDLIEFLAIDLLNSWLLRTMEKKHTKRIFLHYVWLSTHANNMKSVLLKLLSIHLILDTPP